MNSESCRTHYLIFIFLYFIFLLSWSVRCLLIDDIIIARKDNAGKKISLLISAMINERISRNAHTIRNVAHHCENFITGKKGGQSIRTGIYALRFLVPENFIIFIAATPAANRP